MPKEDQGVRFPLVYLLTTVNNQKVSLSVLCPVCIITPITYSHN